MDTLQYTKNILKTNNAFAKKKLGQNFLINEDILKNIIKSADITKQDNIIEIGPGPRQFNTLFIRELPKCYCF